MTVICHTDRILSNVSPKTFTVSLPPDPIWLRADATRIEQVVVNLLNNAAKYTDEGGHIGLTIEQEANFALLRVRDNGVGCR
jgi:signal transduction histidine kinase